MDQDLRELEPVWPEAPRHGPDGPWPRYRFLPGLHPHPRRHPDGSLHGDPEPPPGGPPEAWREDETWLHAVDLYHRGYLWEAHEWWEACYFATRDPLHKQLVQALIQLAAALIQEHLGREAGVRTLVAKVVRRLRSVADALPPGERLAGLDPGEVLAQVEAHFGPAAGRAPGRGDAPAGPGPRLRLA